MKSTSLTDKSVLKILEKQMAEILEFSGPSFEILEDYYSLGDARLTVFRSERLWVVVIEAIRYDAKGELTFFNDIWLYGNAIKFKSSWFADATRHIFKTPLAWQSLVGGGDGWNLAREKFSILWRGERLDFSPTREELAAARVLLSQREWDSGVLTEPQALRYVCHALDHPFFASEDALRDLIDKKFIGGKFQSDDSGPVYKSWYHTRCGDFVEPPTNCDLKLFLQTRDWRHPQADSGAEGISIRDAFEPLARAIATGDLSHWENQDPARFNSHWSNWVETEASLEAAENEANHELIEEGRRFRKTLEGLPADERAQFLADLKADWQKSQQETEDLMKQAAGMGGFVSIHMSGVSLSWGDEVFTLGPHLWEEAEE